MIYSHLSMDELRNDRNLYPSTQICFIDFKNRLDIHTVDFFLKQGNTTRRNTIPGIRNITSNIEKSFNT